MNKSLLIGFLVLALTGLALSARPPLGNRNLHFPTLADASNCSNGTYFATASSTQTTSCANCTAGTFSLGNVTTCFQCPIGTFNNLTSGTSCQFCPDFFSTDKAGQNFCGRCIGGKYRVWQNVSADVAPYLAPNWGSPGCNFTRKTACNTPPASVCLICPKGKYSSDQQQNTGCETCPIHTTTRIVLGESIQDCTACVEGFYGNPGSTANASSCTKCHIDSGISCPENSFLPIVAPGFFRSPKNVTYAYTCIPDLACNATEDRLVTVCNPGYSGFVCGDCAIGYFRLDFFCKPCMNVGVRVVLLLLLIAACLFIVFRLMTKKSKVNVDARIAIQSIQIVGLYSNISTKWPAAMLVVLQMASLTNVNIELFGPECYTRIGYWSKYYLKVTLPLALALLFPLYAQIRIYVSNKLKKGKPVDEALLSKRTWSIFAFFIVGLYTLVISATVQPLNCSKQTDGTFLMTKNPTQLCYTDAWRKDLGGVVFFLLLYAFFFPAGLAYLFWKNKDNLDTADFAVRFGTLVRPYRRGCYWWELVTMLKRAGFVIVLDFLQIGSSRFTVYYVALCTLFFFLWVDIAFAPYATRDYNRFSLTWNMVIILVLICQGLIFERDVASKSALNAFQSILIILLIAMIIYTIYVIVRRLLKGETHVLISSLALRSLNPQTLYAIFYLNSMLEMEKNGVLELSLQALNSRMSYERRLEIFKVLDYLDKANQGLKVDNPTTAAVPTTETAGPQIQMQTTATVNSASSM